MILTTDHADMNKNDVEKLLWCGLPVISLLLNFSRPINKQEVRGLRLLGISQHALIKQKEEQ